MVTAVQVASGLDIKHPLAQHSLKTGDHMAQLIGFHTQYNVPMAPLTSEDPEFKHMDDARVALRLELIWEEFKELLEDGFGVTAYGSFFVPPDDEGGSDTITEAMRHVSKRDGAQVADALGDMVYVIYGMALEMGYDLRDVIMEIHASNMTKLGINGEPIFRDDGKVMKGPCYVKPNIRAALRWPDAGDADA